MTRKYAIVITSILLATPALAAEKIIAPVVTKDGKVFMTYSYKPVPFFPDHEACQRELDSEAFKDAIKDAQKIADSYGALGGDYEGMIVKPECLAVVMVPPDGSKKEK